MTTRRLQLAPEIVGVRPRPPVMMNDDAIVMLR